MGLFSGIKHGLSHALGGLTGGLLGYGAADASKDAAHASQQGMQDATNEYRQGYTGQQALWSPLRDFGMGAIGNLNALNSGNFSSLYNSPDYQFALQQGNQALGQNQAARGNLFSGGAGRELSQYNQGLASQQLGNYRNALFNQLNYGQNATGALSNALGNTTRGIANANMGIGNSQAQGILGQASGYSQGVNNLLGLGGLIAGTPSFGGGSRGGGGNIPFIPPVNVLP